MIINVKISNSRRLPTLMHGNTEDAELPSEYLDTDYIHLVD